MNFRLYVYNNPSTCRLTRPSILLNRLPVDNVREKLLDQAFVIWPQRLWVDGVVAFAV